MTEGPWSRARIAELLRFGRKQCGGWDDVDEDARENMPNDDDADLVAAAPELLAQLKKAVACLPDLNRFDLDPMKAAIAKAEGRP